MTSRRHFIQRSVALSTMTALGGFSRLGLLNALTQPSGSYRALVCVFLYGGNDSNNMVIPMDSAGLANYQKYRLGLALDPTTLLPFANKAYGFHPKFTDILQSSIAPNVAVVANVGTLVQPTSRTQYLNNQVPVPDSLFSHANQQAEMQSSDPTDLTFTGWGGRLADQMSGQNTGSFPTLLTVAGNAVFNNGLTTHPASVTPGIAPGLNGFGTGAGSVARMSALEALVAADSLATDSGAVLLRQAGKNMNNALTDTASLTKALQSAVTLKTVFPTTAIGKQLQQVAELISIRQPLGMNRQIFFCSLGGFDTHTAELDTQVNLYSQLSPALAAFYNATIELNLADQVTTFTESDFSRTMAPNSNGGTDHAWGSHHIVIGGSVKGSAVYGSFPTLEPNGPNDAGSEGRWIPTTAVDQYGATLAQWFGLSASNLASVFPNITKFGTSDVGFFG